MVIRSFGIFGAITLAGCFDPSSPLGRGSSDGDATLGTGSAVTNPSPLDTDGGDVTGVPPEDEESSGGEDSLCGDGRVADTDTEVCDDGTNDGSYGGCTPTCQELGPHCGDGVVQTGEGETCDDGDTLDGNGCNVDCRASGRLLWSATHDSASGMSFDNGQDVDVTIEGTILALGRVQPAGESTPDDFSLLLVYDVEGSLLESHDFVDRYDELAAHPRGYVAVHGGDEYTGVGNAVTLFGAGHHAIWTHELDATNIYGIDVDPDGRVYVAGRRVEAPLSDTDRSFAMLGADGTRLWHHTHDSEGQQRCLGVAGFGDGAVFLCDDYVRRTSDKGTALWEIATAGLRRSASYSDGGFVAVELAGVAAFGPAGESTWVAVPFSRTDDIAIDGAGNVVVVGQNGGLGVAKYTPTGTMLWTLAPDGFAGVSGGRAVAIGPGDAIVVIGTFDPETSVEDRDVWIGTFAP
jgi:cysteine-rich repeat protein